MAVSNAIMIDGDPTDNLLQGTAADDILNGLEGDDLLIGGEGDDQLDGGLGIDRMVGGEGDDLYFVDHLADAIVEFADEGEDLVISSVSYALSENVEALGLLGDGDLDGIGNQQDNFLLGNRGNNLLFGLGGDDVFFSSGGNDVLNGGAGQDEVFYGDMEAVIAFSPVTGSVDKGELGLDQLVEIETIIGNAETINRIVMPQTGNESLQIDLAQEQLVVLNLETQVEQQYQVRNFRDVLGGNQADLIAGDAADNHLEGGGGDDVLLGDGGSDRLLGGSGDDRLGGGLGNDVLSGGSGTDLLIGFGGGASEVDRLNGGSGTDFFVLGDELGAFYQGHDSYAVITDFDPLADFIVLAADPTTQAVDPAYSIQLNNFNQGSATQLDTAILLGDDIIAILPDTTDVSFSRDVIFVDPGNIASQSQSVTTDSILGWTDRSPAQLAGPLSEGFAINDPFGRFPDFWPGRGGDRPDDNRPTPMPEPEPDPAAPAPADENNSLAAAAAIALTEPLLGQVDGVDMNDFYRFTTSESGVFTANLSSLTEDADVRLIRDDNQNGEIDFGEVLAWQWERGNQDESIRRFIDPGDYIVQVFSYNNSNAEYQIGTEFLASETDPLAFSIDLNFGIGLSELSDAAKQAIEEAVEFWETAITHSSFEGPQQLEVTIAAGNLGTGGTLALVPALFPTRLLSTGGGSELGEGDRLLPANGEIVLNQFYFDDYNQNPNYLGDIVRHEMGHVLGIGTLWDYNEGLISRRDSTYSADSYAGAVYGELLGTFEATAVPIEPQINGHWDESAFDRELLTPFAEGIGSEMPLSNLTLASLRDLGWNVNFGAAEPFMLMEAGLG